MPTELFYKINFTLSLICSSIGFLFSLLITIIIIFNRQCHTINNILLCDLCIVIIIYSILHFIGCAYGFSENWSSYQPFCQLRAYIIMIVVTAMSYTFLIQALSQLFSIVFYNRKSLMTWHIHRILIISKWLICIFISIEPFFIENGFLLVNEYRMCAVAIKKLSISLYCIVVMFITPSIMVTFIYLRIVYQVHVSTSRVKSNTKQISNSFRRGLPLMRKNFRIMQRIILLWHILVCGGLPYLILIFWTIIDMKSVPEELYFLSVHFLTLSIAIMMIISFFNNKTVKSIAGTYFSRQY